MREDYLQQARKVISDPYVLINVVSRRVKQLRQGSRPLVESLEKHAPEDVALREIFEGRISFELGSAPEYDAPARPSVSGRGLSTHPRASNGKP